MSRDKGQAKRLYKPFGAATPKRKRKRVAPKSGPPTMHKGRGFKFIAYCPECERKLDEKAVGVSGKSKQRQRCKFGHQFVVSKGGISHGLARKSTEEGQKEGEEIGQETQGEVPGTPWVAAI